MVVKIYKYIWNHVNISVAELAACWLAVLDVWCSNPGERNFFPINCLGLSSPWTFLTWERFETWPFNVPVRSQEVKTFTISHSWKHEHQQSTLAWGPRLEKHKNLPSYPRYIVAVEEETIFQLGENFWTKILNQLTLITKIGSLGIKLALPRPKQILCFMTLHPVLPCLHLPWLWQLLCRFYEKSLLELSYSDTEQKFLK